MAQADIVVQSDQGWADPELALYLTEQDLAPVYVGDCVAWEFDGTIYQASFPDVTPKRYRWRILVSSEPVTGGFVTVEESGSTFFSEDMLGTASSSEGGSSLNAESLRKLETFLRTEKPIVTDPCPPGVIKADQSCLFTQDFETGFQVSDFSSVVFSIKTSLRDPDSKSLLLATSEDNISVLNREPETNYSGDGVLFTMSPAPIISGIRVSIDSTIMSMFESGTLYYCLKGLDPDQILSQGKLILGEAGVDIVTPQA